MFDPNPSCEHIEKITELIFDNSHVCNECIKTGDHWLHLRTCQTCGITLCCDSSPNRHATQHFHETGHPVVISAEPNERWLWCYVDQQFARY